MSNNFVMWRFGVIFESGLNQQISELVRQLVLEKYLNFAESQQRSTDNPVCTILTNC